MCKTQCMKKLFFRFKQFIQIYIWKSDELPNKKALACAVGLGIAFSPFWGFHTLLALLLSWVFRLNKILTIGFSTITIPPIIPVIIAAQVSLGGFLLGDKNSVKNIIGNGISPYSILNIGTHLLVGGLLLAVMVGVISYLALLFICYRRSSLKTLKKSKA